MESRPNRDCDWIDRITNDNPEFSLASLEAKGIPRSKCVAAEFGGSSQSEYQFALQSVPVAGGLQSHYEHKATLVHVATSRVIAELWSSREGGGDKGGGIFCSNYAQFEKMFSLVVPK